MGSAATLDPAVLGSGKAGPRGPVPIVVTMSQGEVNEAPRSPCKEPAPPEVGERGGGLTHPGRPLLLYAPTEEKQLDLVAPWTTHWSYPGNLTTGPSPGNALKRTLRKSDRDPTYLVTSLTGSPSRRRPRRPMEMRWVSPHKTSRVRQ